MTDSNQSGFFSRLPHGEAPVLGVIGLGYVGLPLSVEFARSGYRCLGFDVSERVVDGINAGRSHIQDIPAEVVRAFVGEGLLSATTDLSRLGECDVISICVPTPLNKTKDPDLSYVAAAAHAVLHALRPGQIIILESTTYPGTTREVLLTLFEESGLQVGEDYYLCFSPERVDPAFADLRIIALITSCSRPRSTLAFSSWYASCRARARSACSCLLRMSQRFHIPSAVLLCIKFLLQYRCAYNPPGV
jgi:nucleotide sugar dehydrogenase